MNLFCFSFRGAAWKSGAEEGPVVAPGSPGGLSTLRSVYMCVWGGGAVHLVRIPSACSCPAPSPSQSTRSCFQQSIPRCPRHIHSGQL